MKKISILFLYALFSQIAISQSFTSYFTGDTTDIDVEPDAGICLMGGATENDSAMIWFLKQSAGGDIVVIRASGADGYNDYMYSQLGVNVHSVQTIVFNDSTAAFSPYVAQQIHNAEALWIAGGDQNTYLKYWKNTPIQTELQYLINDKKAAIGGTSAGMTVLGDAYFYAGNGTVTSAAAMADPYNANMTIGFNDFIHIPRLAHLITDSHYDSPDRRARHFAFMARMSKDYGIRPFGIACNEYVAVCIEINGIARVYGDYPNYQEFAYFLQGNCYTPSEPETCAAGQTLTWDRNNEAVKVYKVPGTMGGNNTFDLNTWKDGTGGTWEDWYAVNGVLTTNTGALPPECTFTAVENELEIGISVYPNPSNDFLSVKMEKKQAFSFVIRDIQGKIWISGDKKEHETQLSTQSLPQGFYHLAIKTKEGYFSTIFVKE